MRQTLHGKLSLILLSLLILLGLVYIPLTAFTTRNYIQEINQRLSRTLAKHISEEKPFLKDGRVHKDAMAEIKKLMVINPQIEVYLLDTQGRILAYSAASAKVKRKRVSLEPIEHFLSKEGMLPIVGDDPRDFNRQKIFSVSPIPLDGPTQGYVYVILGGEEQDAVAQMPQRSYILRLSISMMAGILLLVLVIGFILFSRLTRRLRHLTTAMETFHQQGFTQPVVLEKTSPPRDEIDRLGTVFTQMGDRLLQHLQERREADNLRRELVSNVSHDLRTPVTALQGYLETLLLKEGQLTEEQKRNYLATAFKHSEQLGKLISELFELAKLDAHEVPLHVEAFSLAELVQDVVQKFQIVAEKGKLSLQATFAENLPFVSGDIAMIERVLENLLENAFRYTPEGGRVTVSLTPEANSIKMQITDTGRGISQEDLPHIFERSYRGEKHRPELPEGAGLGLAITKRILELHGSVIEVVSTLDAGTTFTFHLPLASKTV